MSRSLLFLTTLGILAALAGGSASAADQPANAGDERLRVAYRDAMVQLQAAQSDLAALQATQAAAAADQKALADKCDALQKQMSASRSASDRAAASLSAQMAKRDAQIAQLNEALASARTEWGRAATAAKAAEAKNTQLSHDAVLLQRRVTSLELKNLSLFLTANEILTRYQDFSFGTALKAKEPFVGLTRTKLENLVQDYRDKLDDQRNKP